MPAHPQGFRYVVSTGEQIRTLICGVIQWFLNGRSYEGKLREFSAYLKLQNKTPTKAPYLISCRSLSVSSPQHVIGGPISLVKAQNQIWVLFTVNFVVSFVSEDFASLGAHGAAVNQRYVPFSSDMGSFSILIIGLQFAAWLCVL